MRRLLRVLGGLALLIALAAASVVIAARWHDGPFGGALGIVAAGAFTTGDPQPGSTEPDWSFLRDYVTVEFQLLDPARSRTTWIMEHEGRIFIVSGYMSSVVGRLWKQWPRQAERDGRAILRVDGKLYQRQMARILEGDIVVPVLAELSRKYLGGAIASPAEVASGGIWLFELKPRR